MSSVLQHLLSTYRVQDNNMIFQTWNKRQGNVWLLPAICGSWKQGQCWCHWDSWLPQRQRGWGGWGICFKSENWLCWTPSSSNPPCGWMHAVCETWLNEAPLNVFPEQEGNVWRLNNRVPQLMEEKLLPRPENSLHMTTRREEPLHRRERRELCDCLDTFTMLNMEPTVDDFFK